MALLFAEVAILSRFLLHHIRGHYQPWVTDKSGE